MSGFFSRFFSTSSSQHSVAAASTSTSIKSRDQQIVKSLDSYPLSTSSSPPSSPLSFTSVNSNTFESVNVQEVDVEAGNKNIKEELSLSTSTFFSSLPTTSASTILRSLSLNMASNNTATTTNSSSDSNDSDTIFVDSFSNRYVYK